MCFEQPADEATADLAPPHRQHETAHTRGVTWAVDLAHAAAAAFIAVLVLVATAGCGSGSDGHPAAASTPYDAAVIVAGATQNTPAPTLSDTVRQALTKVMLAGHPLDVVKVSGTPQVLDPNAIGLDQIPAGGTVEGNQALADDNLIALSKAIASAPKADGASYLQALMMAADKATARGATAAYIVLIGSGLDDRSGLSFVPAGSLGANPDDVVARLRADGTLANRKRLAGVTVVLSGFGYSAPPQGALNDALRAQVVKIWVAVLQSVGAHVIVDPDARTGASVKTTHRVTKVPVPSDVVVKPPTCTTREYVFDSQSAASFNPDQITFVNPAAAHGALDPVAAWLQANPHRTALIRGTTANDRSPAARLRALGAARGHVVASYLTSRRVDPRQLRVVGVGADFPEYVKPDRDPTTDALLPGPAALNRSIRIALTDPCH